MRCLAPFVVVCLLYAGASTKRVPTEREVDRASSKIVAVKALAKIAVRRHDVARGAVAKLDLDPFALSSDDDAAPPPHGVTVEHAVPTGYTIESHRIFDARGPPVG